MYRQYIDHEMYQPENQSPPLGEGHPLSAIRAKARNYRRAGTDVGEILQASQRLAHAQVRAPLCRQAAALLSMPRFLSLTGQGVIQGPSGGEPSRPSCSRVVQYDRRHWLATLWALV